MNKPEQNIKSYKDLLAEKQRLKEKFAVQKTELTAEIASLKDVINPFSGILKTAGSTIGKFISPDKSMGILNTGLGFAVDVIVRKLILKKSNWLVKLAAPFLIRNLLSHLAAYKIKTQMPEMEPVINTLTKTAKKA
jgi:hypothetical protein